MKCQVASVLLLLGLSSALAVTPASRHEHKLHLQQAKVRFAIPNDTSEGSMPRLAFVAQPPFCATG